MRALSLNFSFPLQMHNAPVGKCIRHTKNPSALGRCLVEEGMPIIGVHPFFRETRDAYALKIGLNQYLRYKDDMLEMFSTFTPDAWARAVFFVESSDAQRITAGILESGKINPAGLEYFLSGGGKIEWSTYEIVSWSEHPITGVYTRTSRILDSSNDSRLARLNKLVGHGKAFVFGLYTNDCVGTAVRHLKRLAEVANQTVEIAMNPIATLERDCSWQSITCNNLFVPDSKFLQEIEQEYR